MAAQKAQFSWRQRGAHLVLDAKPLNDIRHTDHIRYVMLNGRLYDAATMDQLAPEPRERAPFWFERPG